MLAACLLTTAATRMDRRIVDTVEVGNLHSDLEHGYAGDSVDAGIVNGQPYRRARGWMHYALSTFDDTPVTIACTFAGGDSVARQYDIIVGDSVIATRTIGPSANTEIVVEHLVPFSLTKGKSHIAIIIRARGGQTPALQRIRTIQDHYELQ